MEGRLTRALKFRTTKITVPSITSPDIHDPQLLNHMVLSPYPPSERRAILHFRSLISDQERPEIDLRRAVSLWEEGPASQWRKQKASRDGMQQADEIERHKYFLSQKQGFDVGREAAAVDWVAKYAAKWRQWWEEQPGSGAEPI